MSTTRRYIAELAGTARIAHDLALYVVAVGTLAISVVAWWRFGLAWGVSTFLGVALVISSVTGRRIMRDVGTLIPPGWNATIHGSPSGKGEWVPPGFQVVKAPGVITDDYGNTVTGSDNRVYCGSHNVITGSGWRVFGSHNNFSGPGREIRADRSTATG